jgi:phage tail-like protein
MRSRRAFVLIAGAGVAAAFAGLLAWPTSNAAAVEPTEPGTVARFSLTNDDGAEIASFSELQGITTVVEPVDFEPNSGPRSQLVVPGKRKPPTIVLRRGMTQDLTLWAWHEQVIANGRSALKNVSLVMYDVAGSPIARYHMQNAWPAKLELGALRAGSSEVLMETVTIVSERIQRVSA